MRDNEFVATLESHVLISACRLSDLKAAPEDTDTGAVDPVEWTTSVLATFSGEDRK